MPEGGKLVLTTGTVAGAELRARFQEVKAEQYALISVADTGLGMDEAVKSRIFEPFFLDQAPGSRHRVGSFSGLRNRCNHGGFIDVMSRPHEGSTFNVYLPIGELRVNNLKVSENSEPNIKRFAPKDRQSFLSKTRYGRCS